MNLLVCGGRNYNGSVECLNELLPNVDILIEGGALGADRSARVWAQSNGIHVATVDALWKHYDKGAGFKRNQAMLMLKVDYCVAFPGNNGTKMMIDLCKNNNVTVWTPYDN